MKTARLKEVKIKNFGILKDVHAEIGDVCTLFIGKNKVGKTTFLEALKRLQRFTQSNIPLKNLDFKQNYLKLLESQPDLTLVEFNIEFEVTCQILHLMVGIGIL